MTRELPSNCLVALVVPHDLQHFFKENDFPFLNLESHLFKMQLMPSPPFSKYLCWDISGEGTSAELMQRARSRVTQSLTSPCCTPVLQDGAPRAILRMCPLLLLLLQLQLPRPPNTSHHHAPTRYHLLLNCATHRSIHNSIFPHR